MLTLGGPPDDRPLYIGKAERSLSSRDVGTHFGFATGGVNSITGSSTFRRSVSAMLRTSHGFRGRYRSHANPQKSANFGLSADQDALLSTWMRENLTASYWEMPAVVIPLGDVEKVVLARLQPPLNIQHAQHEWKSVVKQARAVMAADCERGW
ncbi:GIY-YIG nuclease family protein [Mycobacterium sp. ML4]